MFCPLCAYANGIVAIDVCRIKSLVGVLGPAGSAAASHWAGKILASEDAEVESYLRDLKKDMLCRHQTWKPSNTVFELVSRDPGHGRHG